MNDRQSTSVRRPRRALILFTHRPEVEAARKRLGRCGLHTQSILRQFIEYVSRVVGEARQQADFEFFLATDAGFELSGQGPDHLLIQQGYTFEDRLTYTLQAVASRGFQQIVVVGNDCLDLTPGLIEQAFRQLGTRDVVVGASRDGGFYLLGVKLYRPALLKGLPWRTDRLYRQLLVRLKQFQLSWVALPALEDIDSFQSLWQWLKQPGHGNHPLHSWLGRLLPSPPLLLVDREDWFAPLADSRYLWQRPPPFLLS